MEELLLMRQRFYRQHRFPGIIGCVDCTHVAIFVPKNNGPYPEEVYVNSKGYHSINVQLICDPDMKIINVCARYPGSTHDSYLWSNSNAFQYIQNLHINGNTSFSFLGDSGYALRPWMLTPIQNAVPQYNNRQMITSSIIERCNGILKLRFRCFLEHRVLHYDPTTASKIINSCFGDDKEDQLINIDYGMHDQNGNNEDNERSHRNQDLLAGRRLEQLIVNNYFR